MLPEQDKYDNKLMKLAALRRLQKSNRPAPGTKIGSAITFTSPQQAQNYSSAAQRRVNPKYS